MWILRRIVLSARIESLRKTENKFSSYQQIFIYVYIQLYVHICTPLCVCISLNVLDNNICFALAFDSGKWMYSLCVNVCNRQKGRGVIWLNMARFL